MKIDAENVLFFNIDFLQGSGSILDPLGPPRWGQLGSILEAQEAPKSSPKPEKNDVKKQQVFGIDF